MKYHVMKNRQKFGNEWVFLKIEYSIYHVKIIGGAPQEILAPAGLIQRCFMIQAKNNALKLANQDVIFVGHPDAVRSCAIPQVVAFIKGEEIPTHL